MSKLVEDYAKEYAREYAEEKVAEKEKQVVLNLLKKGMSDEETAQLSGTTLEFVQKVKEIM